jgi:anti-anti-sigma factor
LDLASAAVLNRAVTDLLAAGRSDITVDCAQLSFIDSQGLNLLVDLDLEQRSRGAALAVSGVSGRPLRAFTAGGLADLLA